jgi:hypothetical protein
VTFCSDRAYAYAYGRCKLTIVQLRPGERRILCTTSANIENFLITDRITVNGFREMEAFHPIRWRGEACFQEWPDRGDQSLADPLRPR